MYCQSILNQIHKIILILTTTYLMYKSIQEKLSELQNIKSLKALISQSCHHGLH